MAAGEDSGKPGRPGLPVAALGRQPVRGRVDRVRHRVSQ